MATQRVGRFYVETWRAWSPRGLGSGHLFTVRTVSGECLAHGQVATEKQLPAAIEKAVDSISEDA